jgi:hypothetical protein
MPAAVWHLHAKLPLLCSSSSLPALLPLLGCAQQGSHANLLWHRDINEQMLKEMWHSLVALLHPTMPEQPHTLDELFELLKDATWHDFFQVRQDVQQALQLSHGAAGFTAFCQPFGGS